VAEEQWQTGVHDALIKFSVAGPWPRYGLVRGEEMGLESYAPVFAALDMLVLIFEKMLESEVATLGDIAT
jgi:hypothetical protein